MAPLCFPVHSRQATRRITGHTPLHTFTDDENMLCDFQLRLAAYCEFVWRFPIGWRYLGSNFA